jgi:hypothetical protein
VFSVPDFTSEVEGGRMVLSELADEEILIMHYAWQLVFQEGEI